MKRKLINLNLLFVDNDWYENQVLQSCTYGGKIAGIITGGLNYQIEHHLFPKMCSTYYPDIHNDVKKICNKHKIKYTYYNNIFQNI